VLASNIAFLRKTYPRLTVIVPPFVDSEDPSTLAEGFLDLLADSSIDVLLVSKGGVRTIELLPYLHDITVVGSKSIVGNSDFSHLMTRLSTIPHLRTYIGPSLKGFSSLAPASLRAFEEVVIEGHPLIVLEPSALAWREGGFTGTLLCGNDLAILNTLGKDVHFDVLAIEHHTDADPRMLRYWLLQYKARGLLSNLKGLIIGYTPLMDEASLRSVVLDVCKEYPYPIIFAPVFGESDSRMPFRSGGKVSYIPGKGLQIT
jgi:muramoyltetrapeptide carboxypeptidase LdcA involved in peptidoglycan recycling